MVNECVQQKIEKLIAEGKAKDQAAAIAYAMCGESGKSGGYPAPSGLSADEQAQWEATFADVYVQTGDDLKAGLAAWGTLQRQYILGMSGKSAAGSMRVKGWAMKFTNPKALDLNDMFFDDNTETLLDYYLGAPLWMEHGQDSGYGIAPIGRRVVTQVYPFGVWFEHDLDETHPLYEKTATGVRNGEFTYSTDTLPNYSVRGLDQMTGRLGAWFAAGCSLTRNPAEPGLGAVTFADFAHAVKSAAEAREAQGGDATGMNTVRPSFTQIAQGEDGMNPELLKKLAAFVGVEPGADGLIDAVAVKSKMEALINQVGAKQDGEMPADTPPDQQPPDQSGMPDLGQLRAALGLPADADNAAIAAQLQNLLNMLLEPTPEGMSAKSFNLGSLSEAMALAAKSAPAVPSQIPAIHREQTGAGQKNRAPAFNRGAKLPGLAELVRGIVEGKSALAMKSLGYSTGPKGGYFLREETSSEIIEYFRANTVVMELGATQVPMRGIESLNFRKQLGATQAYYRGEGQQGTQSEPRWGVVNLQLKELIAPTQINRRLLRNSDVDLEGIIRDDLQKAIALRADLAALRGTGAVPNDGGSNGAEPRGVLNTTGVTSTPLGANGAVPTIKDFVDGWGRIEDANVPSSDSWGIAFSPRTKRTMENQTDTTGQLLDVARWSQGNTYKATTQIPNTLTVGTKSDCSEIYLGAWEYLIIGFGMDVEIIVDESVNRKEGEIYIEASMMHDVGVAQPVAFQILTGVRA